MKLAALIPLAVAGCIQTQPSQQYYPQQQPGMQPMAAGAAPAPAPAAAPVATASCQDTLVCYGQCNPLTEQCIGACDQRTTPDSVQNAHALLMCMGQSGCQDQNCVAQQCGAQVTACTNVTLAVAPTAPTAPAAPVSGGGACEQEMQPQYYADGTSLKVPPLACRLSQADLAGAWSSGSGTGQSYVDSSTGQQVGWSSVATSSKWVIGADGSFTEKWKGAYANSGAALARGVSQDNTGTFTVENGNTVKIYRAAANGNPAHTEYYIVYGWFVGHTDVTMTLQGPFSDPPTQKDFDDAYSNSYRNENYHRSR